MGGQGREQTFSARRGGRTPHLEKLAGFPIPHPLSRPHGEQTTVGEGGGRWANVFAEGEAELRSCYEKPFSGGGGWWWAQRPIILRHAFLSKAEPLPTYYSNAPAPQRNTPHHCAISMCVDSRHPSTPRRVQNYASTKHLPARGEPTAETCGRATRMPNSGGGASADNATVTMVSSTNVQASADIFSLH